MGLLDSITGGKSNSATNALKRAEAYFGNVKTPTLEELTLPELQKYLEAGIITPAEAQAYLQKSNAFADQDIPQTGTQAQIEALNQLSGIANAGPEGTPMQQAQMANTLSKMNASVGGQRGAIEQAMAARGTPQALIQAALANQTVGQDAQQAHLDAVNSQAAAYQNALNAMSQGGALGGQLQGQQNQQSNQVAAAQNAMQQFNAQNQQGASESNAGRQQQANIGNTANRQNISNQNTGLANARTEYNAALPQQMFGNAMAKAQGQAGAASNIANLYQQQGQQNAGLFGGLLNAGATVAGSMYGGPAGAVAANQLTKQGNNPTVDRMNQGYQQGWGYAHGGMVDDNGRPCYDDGGVIPGESDFPGDTVMNDDVPINVSPGEAVIPRSSVAQNPEIVDSLIDGGSNQIDPQDVATLLKALRSIRMGAV